MLLTSYNLPWRQYIPLNKEQYSCQKIIMCGTVQCILEWSSPFLSFVPYDHFLLRKYITSSRPTPGWCPWEGHNLFLKSRLEDKRRKDLACWMKPKTKKTMEFHEWLEHRVSFLGCFASSIYISIGFGSFEQKLQKPRPRKRKKGKRKRSMGGPWVVET